MSHVQKIRIIIDAELQDRVPTVPAQHVSPGDQEGYGYEQALFNALRADPVRYAEFIRIRAINTLEILGMNNEISSLAQIRDSYTAGIQMLTSFLSTLPQPAQEYLQDGLIKGWIMDDPDSIYNTVEVKLLQLTVEYPTRQE